jgi:hypothetical protein
LKFRFAAILTCLAAAGCFGQKPLTQDQLLNSSAGVERERGVLQAEREGQSGIPKIIPRLEDDDVAVRMAAIDSLRRMTGQDFGYVAWDDEAKRRAAVAKWREWWRKQPGSGGKP